MQAAMAPEAPAIRTVDRGSMGKWASAATWLHAAQTARTDPDSPLAGAMGGSSDLHTTRANRRIRPRCSLEWQPGSEDARRWTRWNAGRLREGQRRIVHRINWAL